MRKDCGNEVLGRLLVMAGERMIEGKFEISQELSERMTSFFEECAQVPMSKEQACGYLGISRSTFDDRVARGLICRGRHRRGFKEKFWYKSDLR